MATVNYSVPDEVKVEFNQAFAGRNKSAIIARLMMRAVEEHRTRRRRVVAIDALLDLRGSGPVATDEDISAARGAGRP